MAPTPASPQDRGPLQPWWRFRMVWFAIAGPALVVVAALATAVIAVRGADTVLRVEPSASVAHTPAVQARNHAASGGRKE